MKVDADPGSVDARPEFLDLDEPPTRGPLSAWTPQRTLATVAIGVAAALVATLAVTLWPRPDPPLEIVGMADGPVVAWERPVTNPRQVPLLFPCGAERIALVEMTAPDLTITCLEAADGREAWTAKVSDQRSLEVRDLVGTPYLAVGAAPEVTLLNRKTGSIAGRVPLPSQTSDFPATLSGTTSGGLLITSIWTAGQKSGLRVTALKGLDASEPRWRVDLPTRDAGAGLQGGYRPVEERHGYLWDPDYDGSGYALALDAGTGEQPHWSATTSRMAVVDDVVAAQEPGGVAGYQISSGRRLWYLEGGDASLAVAGERTIILVDAPGPDATLDPASGRPTSTVSAIDPWTGRERWRAQVPLVASIARVTGDGVLVSNLRTLNGNAALTMLALDDGAVRWSHEIDGYTGLSTSLGDGYVMVDAWTMTSDPDGSAVANLNDEALFAIDLATGEERWRLDASTPQLVGRRVIDIVDGKVVAYR